MGFEIDIEKAIKAEKKLKELYAKTETIIEQIKDIATTIDDREVLHGFAHMLVKQIFEVCHFSLFEVLGVLESIKVDYYKDLFEQYRELEEIARLKKYRE
jgi:hypothetical protein